MMYRALPMMRSTIKKMNFHEKIDMMDQMLPLVLTNLNFDQKMEILRRMMPVMVDGIELNQMDQMIGIMLPMLMEAMQEKGLELFEMLEIMCPTCLSAATADASPEEKNRVKEHMGAVFSEI